MTSYTTKSGSVYEVVRDPDGYLVRCIKKGNNNVHRITGDWKLAEHVSCTDVGYPLVIEWGAGLDERSLAAGNLDLDPGVMRRTFTSPVTRID